MKLTTILLLIGIVFCLTTYPKELTYPNIELPNSWKNWDKYNLTTEELLSDLDKEKLRR